MIDDRVNPDDDIAYTYDIMLSAIEVLSEFPKNFVPSNLVMPKAASDSDDVGLMLKGGPDINELLRDPGISEWLHNIINGWPEAFLPTFLDAGSVIANILEGFGVSREDIGMGLPALMADFDTMKLMMALGSVWREASNQDEDKDPLGIGQALKNELLRRSIAYHAPFARTLTTLLGHDALLWLTADSAEGIGKIQPHEFSRTGWRNIWSIKNQIEIEKELLEMRPEYGFLAKIVVALSWTLAGLASYLPPSIFFGDKASNLSSTRDRGLTLSTGSGSYTLVSFQTSVIPTLIRILAEGLRNPLISAADLMWMGAGLVKIQNIHVAHIEPAAIKEERFEIFLSHRGRDAKQPLASNVQGLPSTHGAFLDCMVMPRGVINRSFVFGSLARSETVVIVETENFNESDWCRKEAWFADALAQNGLSVVKRMSLAEAGDQIALRGPSSVRERPDPNLQYPIAPRVLRDIDYWARTPNLYSLKENGFPTESLETITALFKSISWDEPRDTVLISDAVINTLTGVALAAPDANPIDLWATALQYSVAAFTSTSAGRSKIEVRQGIDRLNVLLKSLVGNELHLDPVFKARPAEYLGLLAAASAIDLAEYELDPLIEPVILNILGRSAGIRNGLLLLDVREAGAKRNFHLRLTAVLARGNVGSVGIVQNSSDEVHQGTVDGFLLEVLPCITLYPGMKDPFITPH